MEEFLEKYIENFKEESFTGNLKEKKIPISLTSRNGKKVLLFVEETEVDETIGVVAISEDLAFLQGQFVKLIKKNGEFEIELEDVIKKFKKILKKTVEETDFKFKKINFRIKETTNLIGVIFDEEPNEETKLFLKYIGGEEHKKTEFVFIREFWEIVGSVFEKEKEFIFI